MTIIQHDREAPPGGPSLDAAVIVALGSNLPGDRASPLEVLEAALACLSTHGLAVVKRSRWWRSAAWPDPTAPPYLNGAAWLVPAPALAAAPEAVLHELQTLETAFGRVRGNANAPRSLDLDLIAFGRLRAHDARLQLPHPRAATRAFVMGPICDLDPAWRHPDSGETAAVLFAAAEIGRDAHPVDDAPAGSDVIVLRRTNAAPKSSGHG